MRVAADNQDLLADENSGATTLRELVTAGVVKRYGADRIVLDGPDVELSCRHARSLRIVFHEMTTNAVKYGALSDPAGRVEIGWSVDGRMLTIDWRETGGPRVTAPTRHNFGSKLIDVTLKQINARLEPTFAPTGYCYRISVGLG